MADPSPAAATLAMDPWAAFNPQPVGSGAGPVIPDTPPPQTQAQSSKDVSEAATAAEGTKQAQYKTTQEQIATQKQVAEKGMAAEGVDQLVSAVEKAKGLVNGWSTGVTGHVMQHIDGSQAAQLQAIINQEVRGNVFMQRINDMKEENPSPTGGTGIGRIMQSEIPMITGAMGALDPVKMGRQATLDSLNQIEYRALRSKAILAGENPDDPTVAAKYKIPALTTPPPTGPSDGSSAPPGVSDFTPEQQAKDKAFIATNPTPEQYTAFLNTLLPGRAVTPASAKARLDAMSKGASYSGSVVDPTEGQKVQSQIAAENKLGLNQEDPATRVLVHGATLGLSDEASGVGNAAANVVTSPLTGNFDPVGSYKLGRDVEEQRLADAHGQLGYAAAPLEFAGSLASGNPEGAAAGITEALTRGQAIRQGMKSGGAYGVISGFGNGRGLTNSLTGAGVGGATGVAVGGVGGRLFAGRGAPPPSEGGGPTPGDIASAMQAEGLPGGRPIADPSVRSKMMYLETTPGGNNVVRDSLNQTRQSIADKVAEVAGPGTAQTPGGMGETIQNAGTRTLESMKSDARGVYTQAANIAGSTPIQPTKALETIDGYISQLSANPKTNAGVLSYLNDVRSDLAAPGGKTLADIRDIRTGVNDAINHQNLGKTRAEAIMSDVGKSLSSDVSDTLQNASPQALELYNKADGMWSDMSNLRQQVVKKLIGPANNPISGESAMSRVSQMMNNKGDLNRFNRVTAMMTPEERSDFAATLFNNIGQKSAEEPFSPGTFLQQTKNMQPGALKTVFGEDGAQSVQNLRVASRGFTDAQSALNNSRSGAAVNMKNIVGTLVNLKSVGLGGAGYAVGGVPGMIAGATIAPAVEQGVNRISAKTLMNPDVSQWIRKVATAKTAAQARQLYGKISTLAAGNASIQAELAPVRDALSHVFANDNLPAAGQAVASPNGGPNQQQQPNGGAAPAVR